MTASFGQTPAAGAQPSVVADLRSGARLGLLCPTGGYEARAEPDDLVFVPWSDGIGCAPDRAAIVPVFERSEDLPRTSLSNGVSAAEVAVRVDGAHALTELAGVHPDYVLLDPVMTDVRDPRSDGAAVLAAFAGLTAHRAADLVGCGIVDQLQLDVVRDLGVHYGCGPLIDGWFSLSAGPGSARSASERAAWLRIRLAGSTDINQAAAAVCDHVAELDVLPSVYVESQGTMRCVGQRGYWQILDGIPVDMGVIGRAFRTGEIAVVDVTEPGFIQAVPGLAGEIVVPLRVGGSVRGVLSVESLRTISAAERREVERVAAELERTMQRIPAQPPQGAVHRLARATAELATLTDESSVAHAAARLACEVSTMSSAMIALPGPTGPLAVHAAQGPLATPLRNLDPHQLTALTADLGRISSCISGGDDDGRVRPALEALRSAGGTAVGAFPVTCDGVRGLLVVADHAPGELGSELREAMELLAGAIGRALDHVQLVEALRLRAETDALTRVGNRSAFDDALAVLDESGQRTDHLAVLLADLDGFKAINDRFGHLVGDQVLVETADAMARTLRAHDRLFRIGGDEFAVLVSRVDEHSAFDLAARICDAVRSVLDDFGASLSIGVAVLGESEPATACVQRADRSLYEAKRSLPGTAILDET